MIRSNKFHIFNDMKNSDLTSILQRQLDIANQTNRVLLARIDGLSKTIGELRVELAVSSLKRDELITTIISMQEALLEKNTDLGKQKRINKGLSKLITNKSEKHNPQSGTSGRKKFRSLIYFMF